MEYKNNNNDLIIINDKNSINELNTKIYEIIENVKITNKDDNISISNYYILTKTIAFKKVPENIIGEIINVDEFIEIYKQNKIQVCDLMYFNFKKYNVDKIFKKHNFIKKEYYISTIKGCYQNDKDKSWHKFVHELQISPNCDINDMKNNVPQNLFSSARLIILSPFLQTGLGMELILRFENINKIPEVYPKSVNEFLNKVNNKIYYMIKKNEEYQKEWNIPVFPSYSKDLCCNIKNLNFDNINNTYGLNINLGKANYYILENEKLLESYRIKCSNIDDEKIILCIKHGTYQYKKHSNIGDAEIRIKDNINNIWVHNFYPLINKCITLFGNNFDKSEESYFDL